LNGQPAARVSSNVLDRVLDKGIVIALGSKPTVPVEDLLDAVRYEKDAMAYRKTVDAMYSTLKRVSTMRVALKPIPRRRPPIKD